MYRTVGLPSITFKIRFKPGDHFPIVRRKNFTATELIAFIGRLLGLFLGVSAISFAEVVNFLLHPLFKKLSTVICFRKKQPARVNFKTNRFFEAVTQATSYFSFYLKESSIHSFNFIANADNCFECLFWFMTFSLSMTGCAFMTLQLYRTMDFKAITLIINDRAMDVSEIPFPAVTIFGSFPNVVKLWYPGIKSLDEYNFYTRKPKTKTDLAEHSTQKYTKLKHLYLKS